MAELDQVVFLVDDDEAVLDSLQLLLSSVGLVAEGFASGQAFLQAYDAQRSGCLVLDVRMPGLSGLDVAERLREQEATLPIIFITGHGDVPMAVEAMRLGAIDFIQKPFRDQDLLDRIYEAFERDEVNRKRSGEQHIIHQRLATLTPRECQVLDLLVAGKANKVIALELGVSQRTVEIHRSHVMTKMVADSLAALIKMVVSVKADT